MTIDNLSYTPSPVSDKSTLPPAPSDGTIYMVGIGFDINNPTHPDPGFGYFTNPKTALNITASRYGAGATRVGVHKVLGCTAYSSDAYSVNKLYIYIWAVPKAGAA